MIKEKEFINEVVDRFYKEAVGDILIGHQFRKVAIWDATEDLEQASVSSGQGRHHPLKPPMEAFAHHLPRIKHFWYIQLLDTTLKEVAEEPFDLITIHRKLSIRKGELGRWLVLFDKALALVLSENDCEENKNLVEKWKEKVQFFDQAFKRKIF